MNLRKKKKRLKRQVESMRAELDRMLKQPAPVAIERPRVETLTNINYYYPHEYNSRCLRDVYRETASTIAYLIAEGYIECKEELIDDIFGGPMMKVTAKLRVVVPDGGDGI